jgi:predicted amidophosphoribosyltransferase
MKLPVNYKSLTWEERKSVGEEYIKRQKGLCQHCGKPLSEKADESIELLWIDEDLFPVNFFKYPYTSITATKPGKR